MAFESGANKWDPRRYADGASCESQLYSQAQGSFPPGPWCVYVPGWDGVDGLVSAAQSPDGAGAELAALIYGASDAYIPAIAAQAAAAGVTLLYVTDAPMATPWGALPSFWCDLLAALDDPCGQCEVAAGVDCTPDVDCAGEWSACTADCGPKTFTVSVAASGSGSACAAEDGATLTCAAGEGACPEAEAETPPPAPNLNTGDAKADTSGAATASCSIGLLLAAIALAVEAGDVAGLRDSVTFQECEAVAQAMEADTACDAP